MTEHEAISLKIEELHLSILSSHPTMPGLLREIHQNLKKDPAVVTLLSPEQVSIIVLGLDKQTQSTLVATISSAKPSAAAKAKLKNVSTDDLGF